MEEADQTLEKQNPDSDLWSFWHVCQVEETKRLDLINQETNAIKLRVWAGPLLAPWLACIN